MVKTTTVNPMDWTGLDSCDIQPNPIAIDIQMSCPVQYRAPRSGDIGNFSVDIPRLNRCVFSGLGIIDILSLFPESIASPSYNWFPKPVYHQSKRVVYWISRLPRALPSNLRMESLKSTLYYHGLKGIKC